MEPFRTLTGLVAPLDLLNVDTDQIIPKQFLKRIERTGFGPCLFYDWRFLEDGSLNPDFEMNAPRYRGSDILLARHNFGCGSSREHAPWALLDYGIRCLIAPSFADIFYRNCLQNGMLPIVLHEGEIETLFQAVRATLGYRLDVDLEAQMVRTPRGETLRFEIDVFSKQCLVHGWDDISMTLQHEAQILAYETAHPEIVPTPSA